MVTTKIKNATCGSNLNSTREIRRLSEGLPRRDLTTVVWLRSGGTHKLPLSCPNPFGLCPHTRSSFLAGKTKAIKNEILFHSPNQTPSKVCLKQLLPLTTPPKINLYILKKISTFCQEFPLKKSCPLFIRLPWVPKRSCEWSCICLYRICSYHPFSQHSPWAHSTALYYYSTWHPAQKTVLSEAIGSTKLFQILKYWNFI